MFDGEAIGYYVDLLQLISEDLLVKIDLDDIVTQPPLPNRKQGERPERGHYCSGAEFKNLHQQVSIDYGNDAIPLCICISMDDTHVKSLNQKKICPVYYRLLNLKHPLATREEYQPLIGFAPFFNVRIYYLFNLYDLPHE
jgi:hypothetical protein